MTHIFREFIAKDPQDADNTDVWFEFGLSLKGCAMKSIVICIYDIYILFSREIMGTNDERPLWAWDNFGGRTRVLSLGPQYSSMQCQQHKYSSIFWVALMYLLCKTRGISLLSVVLYRKKIMINCQYFVMQMRFSNQIFSLIAWQIRQVVRQVFTKTGLCFLLTRKIEDTRY